MTDQDRIKELEAQVVSLERETRRDPLTNLLNRRGMTRLMVRQERRLESEYPTPSIIMVDLDHFKRVNDECGHAVGDAVLLATAKLIRSELRTTDAACRYGGEEFLILTEHGDPRELAVRIWKRMPDATAKPNPVSEPTTASFGIATFASGLDTSIWDTAVRADRALYKAKSGGRNCIIRA